MKIRVPLWLALTACLGCLALGRVAAQDPPPPPKPGEEQPVFTEYPYLPTRYGEAFIPSVADWQALRLTALGASTTRITEHFSRQHLTCFATPKGLVLTLDLLPEASWPHYRPGGKFAAPLETVKPDLEKAVAATMRFVRQFFSEVRDANVQLRVFVRSESVGVWEAGRLTLNAEKPAEPAQ